MQSDPEAWSEWAELFVSFVLGYVCSGEDCECFCFEMS